MSFAQVNHEAWDILNATPRYTALKAMGDSCDIVQSKYIYESGLNLASRIMLPHRFPTTSVRIWLPLTKVWHTPLST